MKHLKTYTLYERVSKETKLFESSSDEVEEYLNNIFLDVEDKDIELEIEGRYISTLPVPGVLKTEKLDGYKVMIGVKRNDAKRFQLADVYDNIQMAKSYMSDEGFFIRRIRGLSPDKYGELEVYELFVSCNLYDNGKGELFEKPLVYLEVLF
jgi:hypothetical protein